MKNLGIRQERSDRRAPVLVFVKIVCYASLTAWDPGSSSGLDGSFALKRLIENLAFECFRCPWSEPFLRENLRVMPATRSETFSNQLRLSQTLATVYRSSDSRNRGGWSEVTEKDKNSD